eukprot:TRINITY_DN5999_c0_g3_i1.p1 TRINITY_DN5999_c0_g3~~TRINITY_DN5999_c0_g3_i1.p1  ORF type:complete len:695 (-),score=188.20 TRINITY_DN5999_c0_g3_i1:926-3010(-)
MLVNSESKMLCAAAVHLVSFDGTPNIPQTGQAFLKDLFKIKKPVKTVPIIGLARRGKSVFHNCFINCPANVKGFAVSHSFNSCTKGLWALAREMEEHILLCVDVEGMFAPDAKTDNDEKIATLVCLMSSVLLYNASTPINTMELSKLQFVSEYGAVVIRDGKRPPLPPIVFLLRDNINPNFREQEGVDEYVKTKVKPHLPHFSSIIARTIPKPSIDMEAFIEQHREAQHLHLHARGECRAAMAEVFHLVENVQPRVMENFLFPPEFKDLLEEYVIAFAESDKFPEPSNRVSELLIPKAEEDVKKVFSTVAAHLSLDTGNLGYNGQDAVFFGKQVEMCSLLARSSMVEGWMAVWEEMGDTEAKSRLPEWALGAIECFETACSGEVYTMADWCQSNMPSLMELDWSFVRPYSKEIAAKVVRRVEPWVTEQSINFRKLYDSGVRQKATEEAMEQQEKEAAASLQMMENKAEADVARAHAEAAEKVMVEQQRAADATAEAEKKVHAATMQMMEEKLRLTKEKADAEIREANARAEAAKAAEEAAKSGVRQKEEDAANLQMMVRKAQTDLARVVEERLMREQSVVADTRSIFVSAEADRRVEAAKKQMMKEMEAMNERVAMAVAMAESSEKNRRDMAEENRLLSEKLEQFNKEKEDAEIQAAEPGQEAANRAGGSGENTYSFVPQVMALATEVFRSRRN